jgi:hypothetical protein
VTADNSDVPGVRWTVWSSVCRPSHYSAAEVRASEVILRVLGEFTAFLQGDFMGGHRTEPLVTGICLVALAVGGCGGGSTSTPSTVTVHDTPPSAASPTLGASPAAQSWTMPDLRGKNLQDAQDAIQTVTNNQVFYTGSTDLTGKGRHQVMDRNWQVCASTPPPGATFTKETSIDFGVVRIDSESCP